MKRIIYPVIVLSCMLLVSTHVSAQKYVKVVEATSQSWSGGRVESGTGVTYSIKVAVKSCQKVKFDGFWAGSDYCVPEVLPRVDADTNLHGKIDTISLRCTVHHYQPQSQTGEKPTFKSPPVPLKSEALLGFVMGKSKRYTSIDNIKKLPPRKYQ